MTTTRRSTVSLLLALALVAIPASAQNRTRFGGRYVAWDYAYGLQPNVAPLQVATGNTVTGVGSLTLVSAFTTLSDGTRNFPVTTTTPITVDAGANVETVTPSTVSNCSFDAGYATCVVTATFTYTHGNGTLVTTGSFGVQEAINAAFGNGGGTVVVDRTWQNGGGTTAKITGATAYSNVAIEDTRSGEGWYGMQPTTLTSLAAPTTLAAGTVVFAAAPVGTWANSSYFFAVTCVDPLGGEGPPSATYNQTPTLNYSVTITGPTTTQCPGAVGWRFYAGASYNAAYLMPIDSTHCTLTTLESVMPACAIGSNGGWIAPPLTTTTLRPNAQSPTVNLNTPFPQGHTTFGYQPTSSVPQVFQQHYGPFPAFGALSAGQIAVVGSANLPAGFMNVIGRVLRLTGKLTLGSTNTATLPTLAVQLGWVGGTTAGVPVSACAFSGPATGSTVVYNMPFTCTLTTNAVGATAIGSVMPDGSASIQVPTGAAIGQSYTEQAVAAIGSLGLFAQDTVYVTYTSTTNATAAPQLLDLHVEVLQ